MTIIEAQRAARDEPDFRIRVLHFVVKAAIDVQAELDTTTNHADRVVLAGGVLENPDGYVTRFAQAVMTNATILGATSHSTVPDADIEFVVNSLWDAEAG